MTSTLTTTTTSGSGSSSSSGGSGGSGLIPALTIRAALASSTAKTGKIADIDVSRELGLELEETMYANRLLALTNPGKYHEEREIRFTGLKTAAP